jgi:hypothetical protein
MSKIMKSAIEAEPGVNCSMHEEMGRLIIDTICLCAAQLHELPTGTRGEQKINMHPFMKIRWKTLPQKSCFGQLHKFLSTYS